VPDIALPPLREPYQTALDEAVSFIVQRYEPIGILATGTIVRGNPGPNSDLDLFVLWHRPERQRVQRFFHGIPAEIFVNPPERITGYIASDQREGRPVTAHMFATGFVVLDPTGAVASLREAAIKSLAEGPRLTEEFLTSRRYQVATCFEDATDVIDAEPDTGRMLLYQAVEGALAFRFLRQRVWIPRHKEILGRLAELDSGLADLAHQFYRTSKTGDQLRFARDIVKATVGETGTFEWESHLESTEAH
jgi:hypothetical protein